MRHPEAPAPRDHLQKKMSFSNLFKLSYWLAEAPALTPPAFWAMGIFFVLFLAAAIALKVVSRRAEPALARGLRKISRLCGWLGAFGLVILFFRYEFVPLLSRRLTYLLWLTAALAGAGSVLRYFNKQLPELRRREAIRRQREKYLP